CAVILLALIIIPIVPIEVSRTRAGQLESVVSSIKTIKSESKLGYEPDIYYIILDRYAGQKTLSEMYHFDNSLFLTELQSKGFYIATDSHTNYPSTSFSIAASLNM